MATFELNSGMLNPGTGRAGERFERGHNPISQPCTCGTCASCRGHSGDDPFTAVCSERLPPVKQENIISFKVYDNCRQPKCKNIHQIIL